MCPVEATRPQGGGGAPEEAGAGHAGPRGSKGTSSGFKVKGVELQKQHGAVGVAGRRGPGRQQGQSPAGLPGKGHLGRPRRGGADLHTRPGQDWPMQLRHWASSPQGQGQIPQCSSPPRGWKTARAQSPTVSPAPPRVLGPGAQLGAAEVLTHLPQLTRGVLGPCEPFRGCLQPSVALTLAH